MIYELRFSFYIYICFGFVSHVRIEPQDCIYYYYLGSSFFQRVGSADAPVS
jgi:hypothetical protein